MTLLRRPGARRGCCDDDRGSRSFRPAGSAWNRRRSRRRGPGAVTVGGGAPIVVQSMTNTDTADIEATARQVAALARAGSELVRITVDRDEAAAAVPHIRDRLRSKGHRSPADRRLPLYRPQAADRSSRLRRGARQIPHQPRQRRLQEQARRSVLDHRRTRDPSRQGRPHRRELGLARSGTADFADGRERQQRGAAGGARGDARSDDALRAAFGGARGGDRPPAGSHHPLGEGLGRAGPDRGLPHARQTLELRDPSRSHRGGHGLEGHRRLVGRAGHSPAGGRSATRSGSL